MRKHQPANDEKSDINNALSNKCVWKALKILLGSFFIIKKKKASPVGPNMVYGNHGMPLDGIV